MHHLDNVKVELDLVGKGLVKHYRLDLCKTDEMGFNQIDWYLINSMHSHEYLHCHCEYISFVIKWNDSHMY